MTEQLDNADIIELAKEQAGTVQPADIVRTLLDMVDNMEDNADWQQAHGTDPMVVHQKRHDLKCIRGAIATALGGNQ